MWEGLHQQLGFLHQLLKAGFGTTFGQFENLGGMFWHSRRAYQSVEWLVSMLFEHRLEKLSGARWLVRLIRDGGIGVETLPP